MKESLFPAWVQQFFNQYVVSTVETINDSKKALTYMYKDLLTPEFSLTGKWEALTYNNQYVAADVVAYDSTLPLKSRPVLSSATGDIPKIGLKLKLNETQLNNIDTMIKSNSNKSAIVAKIFDDTSRAIVGVNERLELMFLQGFSSGVTEVIDTENVGTSVEVDYGYMTANKFGVATANTPVLSDVQKVLTKVQNDGNSVSVVYSDSATINKLMLSTDIRILFAASIGINGSATTPAPTFAQFNALMQDNYGVSFVKVDRTVKVEIDGKRKNVTPWKAGSVIFANSGTVGDLVYATLAEENHPVNGVVYQKADSFTLVSKYSKNEPLTEFTSTQARVVPVITNVDQIYMLDTTTVQA